MPITSEVVVDSVDPTAVAVSPVDGATDMPSNVRIVVKLSERLDVFSLTETSFRLELDGVPVDGSRSFSAGRTRDLPVPVRKASAHARVFDHARLDERSQ